jgi:GAF domain-containing protein
MEFRGDTKPSTGLSHLEDALAPFSGSNGGVRSYGELEYFIAAIEDITSRKEAGEALAMRARQQSAVAELGRQAFIERDLPSLMDEAVALVAHSLKAECCEVLELLPDAPPGQELLLRSGVGWREGLVGEARVGAGQDTQAGYALFSGTPVIVEDISTETCFELPAFYREHGLVSGMSVVVRSSEHPFGVLGVHTKECRAFTADDANFVRSIANVLATAIERKAAEKRLGEITELERRRIAVDLHDEVLQDLIYALNEIQFIRAIQEKEFASELEGPVEALQRSVEGLRAAIFELRLEETLEHSFASSLKSLVDLNR